MGDGESQFCFEKENLLLVTEISIRLLYLQVNHVTQGAVERYFLFCWALQSDVERRKYLKVIIELCLEERFRKLNQELTLMMIMQKI